MSVNNLCLSEEASIRDVLERLQESALQLALIIDREARLVGIVSDGDVRRGLLGSLTLEDGATLVMNRTYEFVSEGYDPLLIQTLMESRGIRHLPVLDKERRILGLIVESAPLNLKSRSNTVVIMAGGQGKRLRPLTEQVPKPLLKVGGVPILELIIRGYAAQGFSNFVLSLGYLGDSISQHFGDGSNFNVRISYIQESEPLGTAGALSLLDPIPVEPVIVSNADVISSIDLGALLETHLSGKFELTIATRLEHLKVQYGVLEVDNGRVWRWDEKPIISASISAGVYAMDPKVIKALQNGYTDIPELVQRLLDEGRRVGASGHEGLWLDVGDHDSLQSAMKIGDVLRGGENGE